MIDNKATAQLCIYDSSALISAELDYSEVVVDAEAGEFLENVYLSISTNQETRLAELWLTLDEARKLIAALQLITGGKP